MANEDVMAPSLTPAQINEALQALATDDERREAIRGVCGECGSYREQGRCWCDYESPAWQDD